MENKIYNAIKKGIANALVLDDDSPINYQKSEISNEGKMTFQVLAEMFKDDNDILFNIDTSDFFKIIKDDGKEYPLNNYSGLQNMVMLMVKFPENDEWTYIALQNQHYIDGEASMWYNNLHGWRKLTSDNTGYDKIGINIAMEIAEEDFDGYKHTYEYIENYEKDLHRFSYHMGSRTFVADQCRHQIDIKGDIYKSYLPASGEIYLIYKYLDMLNYIFKKLHVTEIYKHQCFWSSTEYNEKQVWCVQLDKGLIYPCKDSHQIATNGMYLYPIRVLPLFKKIMN